MNTLSFSFWCLFIWKPVYWGDLSYHPENRASRQMKFLSLISHHNSHQKYLSVSLNAWQTCVQHRRIGTGKGIVPSCIWYGYSPDYYADMLILHEQQWRISDYHALTKHIWMYKNWKDIDQSMDFMMKVDLHLNTRRWRLWRKTIILINHQLSFLHVRSALVVWKQNFRDNFRSR